MVKKATSSFEKNFLLFTIFFLFFIFSFSFLTISLKFILFSHILHCSSPNPDKAAVSLINCLHSYSSLYRDDLVDKAIKPIQKFLQHTNSNFSMNPTPNFSSLSYKNVSLVSYHFRVHEKAWTF